ncbi:MAG: septation regulator SpoVG [Candidatus Izimaplasma sp.]|nr:septation regulator SpoVG [Candidatus Izimaplasma bacterium]
MKITDVRVKKINGQSRLKAIAAITFDDNFVVHELRIIDGRAGLFVAMPSRKMPNGEFKDVAHPINQETRDKIEGVVIDAYNKLLDEVEEPVKEPEEEPEEEPVEETEEETDDELDEE